MPKRTFAALALAALTLAGCAAPSSGPPLTGSQQTHAAATATFGGVDRGSLADTYARHGQEGKGFTVIRRFSVAPEPTRFGPEAPPRFDTALVLDVGIEMKTVADFPLYRLALKPQKIHPDAVRGWPAHVVLTRTGEDGRERRLAARLPSDRRPDADGFIWTPWTYCADCFGLREIDQAGAVGAEAALSLVSDARAAAAAPNGAPTPYDGMTLFLGLPGVGLLEGQAAHEMAPKAAQVVARATTSLTALRPALKAYQARSEAFINSLSPSRAVALSCGTYMPSAQEPGQMSAADLIKMETTRFHEWEVCATAVINDFDRATREAEIIAFTADEARLAEAARLPATARVRATSLKGELEEARENGRIARRALERRVGALEAAAERKGELRLEPGAGRDVLVGPDGFELGGNVADGLPEEARQKIEEEQAPPYMDEIFVTRLMSNGGNLEIGLDSGACLEGIACETGKIVPLIEVLSYCEVPGGMTRTRAGAGLVVSRYLPSSRAEELRITEEMPGVFALADGDLASLEAGIAAMEAETLAGGDRRYFHNFMDFYPVSHDEKGCKSDWRDGAHHKVVNNL